MKVSVIIPAYNEEKAIENVIHEVLPYTNQIVIVNDGSIDATHTILTKLIKQHSKIKYLRHRRNLGKVAALRNGVKESDGDIIVFIDADHTYPAHYIPLLVKELTTGADIVLGNRFASTAKNIPLLNRIGNRIFSLLITYITCVEIQDGQTGMRAFLKKNFDNLDVTAEGLEYETKMTVKAAKLGYTIVEIPIEYRKRIGSSKLRPFRDGWNMFYSLLSTLYHETSLLARMIMLTSMGISSFGVVLGLSFVVEYLRHRTITHPYYPILSTLFLVMGTQLFSVGLILDNVYKKISMIARKLK